MSDIDLKAEMQKYGPSLLNTVLVISLAAGILFPSILYAVLLRYPTPADVLVAISICLFSSIVYLWTLHAISIITFRDQWMAKAIFGAAITGILGTSAAVYKSELSDSFPFDGKWDLHIVRVVGDNEVCVWYGKILVANNVSTHTYSGLAENTNYGAACPYGIQGLSRIEWNPKDGVIGLSTVNFSDSSHPLDNAAPTSLNFDLEKKGTTWVSKVSTRRDPSAAFRLTLERAL